MPVDIKILRSLARSLPSVDEALCHGTPALYVRRKLLARLQEDGETLSMACPKARRDELIEQHPDVFSVTEHFRNYDYILMNLPATNVTLLKAMLESAWRMKATKKQVAEFDSVRG